MYRPISLGGLESRSDPGTRSPWAVTQKYRIGTVIVSIIVI